MSLSHRVREKWAEIVNLGWLLLNGYSAEERAAYRNGTTGKFSFRSVRSIWIHGRTRESFIAAGGVIDAMRSIASESCFVLTSDDPMVEAWLRTRFPDDRVFTYPAPKADYAKRFLGSLAPQMILLLEEARGFNSKVWAQAIQQKIPIVLLDGVHGSAVPGTLSHQCLRDASEAERLRRAGITSVTATGSLLFEAALRSVPVSGEGFRREAGVGSEASFVFVERPGAMEEVGLLEALMALRKIDPGLIFLWLPPTVWHLRRMKALLERRRIAYRHWGDRRGDVPAVMLLDPRLASAPFHSVSRAIIAGGSFSSLRLRSSPIEPITRHAPVVFGTCLARNAKSASLLIDQGAAVQCPLKALAATLAPLISGSPQRDQLLARVAELLEPSRNATEKTVEVIAPFYPALPGEHPAGLGWRKKKSREEREASKNPAERIEKIAVKDWEAFRARVGACCSILCLGNGPTSEEPRVKEVPHDTLFRANWRWIERGILTHPDAVFVGDPVTIGKMELSCVFVFPDPEREFGALRSTRIVTRKAPIEHFSLTQSSCEWLVELATDAYARPSNGALMIATACALQPECLTIAGMDLFSHSDGRYPGDLQGVNAYSGCHDSEYELQCIERALHQYRGRLVILSPILVEALIRRGFPADRLTV